MRRTLALLICLAVAVPGLVACGASETPGGEVTGADGIEVSGEVGSAPEVAWDGRMTMGETESKVLEEGDGATVESGDRVLAHLWVGNGYTNQVAFSTYDARRPELLTVGADLVPGIREAVEGQAIGSRVMVAATPEDAFGEEGNAQLGIGNSDSVLFVVDLVSGVLDAPEGTSAPLPGWMPSLVEEDGTIAGWDFAGSRKPDGRLHEFTLIEGTGEKLRKSSSIAARYLGQVYGGKRPFDGNYAADDPTLFDLDGGLVEGWKQGLVGVPVGSRVVLVVPPRLGYGKKGNKQAGIKGTDTMYFVLDVLAAA